MARKKTKEEFIAQQLRNRRTRKQAEATWRMLQGSKRAMKDYYALNGQTSLTYGVLPAKKDFMRVFAREVPDDCFNVTLRGPDARAARGTVFEEAAETEAIFDGDDTWTGIKQLTSRFNNKRDEEAGDLASSILTVFGYEWI